MLGWVKNEGNWHVKPFKVTEHLMKLTHRDTSGSSAVFTFFLIKFEDDLAFFIPSNALIIS